VGRIYYLDSNATTPLDPQVREAMAPYLAERFANPSSIYKFAQEFRGEVEAAREQVPSSSTPRRKRLFLRQEGPKPTTRR